MKRHQLLIFGALVLSLAALALAMPAPSHTEAAAATFAPVAAVPLRRFHNPNIDYHYYTTKPGVVFKPSDGFQEQQSMGYAFRKFAPGTVPLYTLFMGQSASAKEKLCGRGYFFTISKSEADDAIAKGWGSTGDGPSNFGVAGYVSPTQIAGTVPLYRLYKPLHADVGAWLANGADTSNLGLYMPSAPPCGDAHFYTIDKSEMTFATQNGYQLIRKEGYVWTNPVTLDASPLQPGPGVIVPLPEAYYTEQLFNLGCQKDSGGNINCPSKGYSLCEGYRKEGKIKAPACLANFDLAAFNKLEADLAGLGCKRFLGRVGEYNCESWAGGEACNAASNTTGGFVTKCYTPQQRLVLSYQNSFGREPTAKEAASWKGTWIQGTYEGWMKAHSDYLRTPAADMERKGLVNRNYLEVQGRNAKLDESNYWLDKIAKGDEWKNFAEMRKANIDWILRSDNDALLREIIKHAFFVAGSGKPTPTQIDEWVAKARAQRLTFKLIAAKLTMGFPKKG